MELFENWALTLIVFLPLVGALVALAIPKEREEAVKMWSLLVSGVTLLLAVAVAVRFNLGAADSFQFEVNVPWIGAIGANYHIGVDGISLPLLVLSALVVVLCVVYSWTHWDEPRNPRRS